MHLTASERDHARLQRRTKRLNDRGLKFRRFIVGVSSATASAVQGINKVKVMTPMPSWYASAFPPNETA
jgi:hypothetical protein